VSALKRELQRWQETVNTQHVQRRLGGLRLLNIGDGRNSRNCRRALPCRPTPCRLPPGG
jgi:hypothetical protein